MQRVLIYLVALIAAYALGYELARETGALIAGFFVVGGFIALDHWRLDQLARWLKSDPLSMPAMRGFWIDLQYLVYKRVSSEQARVQAERDKMNHFFSAVQASPNGVALLDGLNKIEWLNAQLARHLDINQTRDQGQRIAYVVRNPEFVDYLAAHDFSAPITLTMLSHRRVEVQCFEIGDHRYAPYSEQRKLLLTRDVTEQERTDTMRRDFVANVSHELKTPLTVLKGFVETLQSLELTTDERTHYLEVMHTQANRMHNLVNDLLTLAKLESDTRPPESATLQMHSMMEALRAQASALSMGRHVIEVKADALNLLGSQHELMSAFSNLLSNAVHYTPGGGTISLLWVAHEAGADFTVRDTGIGIAAEHITRLTERFYRVDRGRGKLDSEGRELQGGTGLGLAIVKHALQRHGAELIIESIEGQGSCFTARFSPSRIVLAAEAKAATAPATL